MEKINFMIQGVEPILLNNPRTVDPFDKYAKAKKLITNKRKKVDEDLLELRRLEVESKVYWDDQICVYIPSTWILASVAANSWNKIKVKKAEIRSSVFVTESRIKLHYSGMEKVKTLHDISMNDQFTKTMLLKQGQVKIAKAAPIFHDWKFSAEIEFDQSVIDKTSLINLLEYGANYGGYGDFRPTYGRARFIEQQAIRKIA